MDLDLELLHLLYITGQKKKKKKKKYFFKKTEDRVDILNYPMVFPGAEDPASTLHMAEGSCFR